MDSLSSIPEVPLINIKRTDENSVSLSHGKSNPITQVAIQHIQSLPAGETNAPPLSEQMVHLKGQEEGGKLVRISVEIDQLAKALHIEPEKIKNAASDGHLEQIVEKSLKEQELKQRINEIPRIDTSKLTEQDKIRVACEYAFCIAKLHEFALTHLVQKTDLSADIWSLGSVLADITHGSSWYHWSTEHLDETEHGLFKDLTHLEVEKGAIFTERGNEDHPDHIINQCLQENPNNRPSAKQVADALIASYNKKYGEGSFEEEQS